MCAPVGEEVTRARDQDRNLRSASTSIPGPKPPEVQASGCSAVRYGPMAAPSRLPVQDSARRHPPDLRERAVPGLVGGPPEERVILLLSGTVRQRPVHRDHAQARSRTPPAPVGRCRPRHLLEQHPHRVRAELAAPAGQGRDVRLASTRRPPRRRPSARVQAPGQQVRAPAAGGTGRRRAWPSPARTRCSGPGTATSASTKYTISRAGMQPAPLLSRVPRHLNGLIDQLRRERPGQHPDRDPVRQPAVRRQTLRTIMSHKNGYITTSRLKARTLAEDPGAAPKPAHQCTGSAQEDSTDDGRGI